MERVSKIESILESKDVVLNNKKKDCNINIETNFYDHLDTLMYFHNLFDKSVDLYEFGLSSNIWKDIEIFKVWNRRGRKVLYKFDNNECKNIIYRAELCIDNIYKLPYIEMINKSMDKKEICLGKPYENNIWFNEKLNIIDISKVSFNMIENDYYKYLLKVKKRKGSSWNNVISKFMKFNYLNNNSKNYIISLLSYPYEAMKYMQKLYLLDNFNNNEVLEKILELIIIDKESLI